MWASRVTNGSIGEVLGLGPLRSDFDLMTRLDAGLPVQALFQLSDRVAPNDKTFRNRLVPRATLARRLVRQADATLSADEGAKVARLAKAWSLALLIWGDEAEARAFLWRAHPLLEGRAPIDVLLASEFGGPIVENILRQLEYSSAV